MSHAEALLLVDYGKSQVPEDHAFLDDLVGADKEVDPALLQLFDDLSLLLGRAVP